MNDQRRACGHCGRAARDGDRFCAACGASLVHEAGGGATGAAPLTGGSSAPSKPSSFKGLMVAVLLILAVLLAVAGWRVYSGRQPIGSVGAAFVKTPKVSIPVARLQELTSFELQPSDKPQACPWDDKVFVTVPGDTLKGAEKLVISSVGGLRNPALPVKSRTLAMIDVSLGDLHKFAKSITIEFSYAAVQPAPAQEDSLVAFCWDKSSGQWMTMPSRVDKARKRLVVLSDHLSTFAYAEDQSDGHVANHYFSLSYDVSEINGFIKAGSMRPGCVEEVWKALNESRQKYVAVHFEDLPHFAWKETHLKHRPGDALDGGRLEDEEIVLHHNVFLADSAAGAYRDKRGTMTISYDVIKAPRDFMESQVAHEVFHAIQNNYYNFLGMTEFGMPFTGKPEWQITARSWWLDATADYAAFVIVGANGGEPNHDMGNFIDPKYLEKSLLYAPSQLYGLFGNDPHENHNYNTAWFVYYLVKEVGANFKDMFVAISKMDNPSIAANLDAYLATEHRKTLASVYRDFAGWWLFDGKSPLRNKSPTIPPVSVSQSLNFPLASKRIELPVSVDGNYATRVLKITAETSKDQPSRNLNVRVADNRDDLSRDVTVMAYLLSGDLIDSRGEALVLLDPLMLFGGGSTAKLPSKMVELKGGDALYVMVVNAGSSASLNLEVLNADVQVDINPAQVKDGEPDKGYTFVGMIDDIPPAVKKMKIQWLRDGAPLSEETVDVQKVYLNTPMTAEFDPGPHRLTLVVVDLTQGDARAKEMGRREIPVHIKGDPLRKLLKKKTYYRNGALASEYSYYDSTANFMPYEELHGQFTSFHENGNKKALGRYENNLKVGPWQEWFADGSMQSEGTYVKGRKEGAWTSYSIQMGDRKMKLECSYRNDALEGRYLMSWPNGTKHLEKSYVKDSPEGPMSMWYESGKIAREGAFRNGLPEGPCKSYFYNNDNELTEMDEETLSTGYVVESVKHYYENGVEKRVVREKPGKK